MSDLFVDAWGAGTPVVLVHGSLATGGDEWQAQRPLADEGFRRLVLDRRGYGQSARPTVKTSCGTAMTSPISWAPAPTSFQLVSTAFPKLVVSGGTALVSTRFVTISLRRSARLERD